VLTTATNLHPSLIFKGRARVEQRPIGFTLPWKCLTGVEISRDEGDRVRVKHEKALKYSWVVDVAKLIGHPTRC